MNDRTPHSGNAPWLNLVIAAIKSWNTPYREKATDYLEKIGQVPESGLLPFTSPHCWGCIILTGNSDWHSGATERRITCPLCLGMSKRWAA